MSQPACAQCRYWQPLEKDKGHCRRHAPQLVEPPSPYEKHPLRIWPSTLADDWCGDLAARDGE